MKFKTYQHKKIKNYLINNQLLLIFNGINQKESSWVETEQNIKMKNLLYYQVYIKLLLKVIKQSKFRNILKNLNGSIFFFKTKKKHLNIKKEFLEFSILSLLVIKLYNNIYLSTQTKAITCFNYKIKIKTLYQFLVINLKFIQTLKIKKFEKM